MPPSRDPDQRRMETFHRSVYGQLRPYRLRNATIGTGEEGKLIRDCIEDFAEEIADYAEKFMEMHQYERIDDLILTGGGSLIPNVREALQSRLEVYGTRKVHMYVNPSSSPNNGTHPLDLQLVRGATALGGASVYFDFAE